MALPSVKGCMIKRILFAKSISNQEMQIKQKKKDAYQNSMQQQQIVELPQTIVQIKAEMENYFKVKFRPINYTQYIMKAKGSNNNIFLNNGVKITNIQELQGSQYQKEQKIWNVESLGKMEDYLQYKYYQSNMYSDPCSLFQAIGFEVENGQNENQINQPSQQSLQCDYLEIEYLMLKIFIFKNGHDTYNIEFHLQMNYIPDAEKIVDKLVPVIYQQFDKYMDFIKPDVNNFDIAKFRPIIK